MATRQCVAVEAEAKAGLQPGAVLARGAALVARSQLPLWPAQCDLSPAWTPAVLALR